MALGDLHVFTGEEYVDTELAPLLNENFNSLKEYVDDASRWQVMPVQFKGTNAKFLIHETTLGTGTTQVLPLVVLDNTDIAKFSACSLKVVMSTKNGSTAAVNCDISLQKVHNSNECNVNFNTTNSDDAKAEPCTFTYNNIKYAGLKLTTGNADTLWVSGYTTEEWIAPVVDTSVTNLVTLGSDMNVIPTLFKGLQTDKSPVNDYDVVNKKSLNDLTNIKTYSQLSQIGLSGGVLDNSPYAIGNALPANSMLIVGIGGEENTYNYPVTMGNLTVIRSNTNHVFYEITSEEGSGYARTYVLQFTIDTATEDTAFVWKRVLTDFDTGYWQPNETVTKGTVRKLLGAKYAGCFLVCKVAGTTGSTQPSPDPADGAGIGDGSGSITFYSSLQELGIVQGQETMASISASLPLNSELRYYYYPDGNFNDSMYPVTDSYGIVRCTKSTDSNVTDFMFTRNIVEDSNNYLKIYVTSYNSTGGTPQWQELATQSDIPDIASEAEAKAGTNNTKFMTPLRTKEAIAAQVQGIPVGDVVYRPFLMTGYVKANGATVNRSDYPNLVTFANNNNLWTSNPASEPWKYGVGNGSTTMVLPDYRNRFIEGSDNVSILSGKLTNNIPDYSAGVLLKRDWDKWLEYTVPADGVIVPDFTGYGGTEKSQITINGTPMFQINGQGSGYITNATGEFLVKKGDVIRYYMNYTNTTSYSSESVHFYPFKVTNNGLSLIPQIKF